MIEWRHEKNSFSPAGRVRPVPRRRRRLRPQFVIVGRDRRRERARDGIARGERRGVRRAGRRRRPVRPGPDASGGLPCRGERHPRAGGALPPRAACGRRAPRVGGPGRKGRARRVHGAGGAGGREGALRDFVRADERLGRRLHGVPAPAPRGPDRDDGGGRPSAHGRRVGRHPPRARRGQEAAHDRVPHPAGEPHRPGGAVVGPTRAVLLRRRGRQGRREVPRRHARERRRHPVPLAAARLRRSVPAPELRLHGRGAGTTARSSTATGRATRTSARCPRCSGRTCRSG